MTAPTFETFEEFWPYYLSQHLDDTCRRLHYVGTTGVIGCVAVSPVVPQALLAAPVFGYGFAWLGHFVFEKNRPATFDYAKWSLMADFVMYKRMLTGQLKQDLKEVRAMVEDGTAPWLQGTTEQAQGARA